MPLEDPHLRDLADDIRTITIGVRELGDRFTSAQQTWRPEPESWCMLECVEHLIKTGELYHPVISSAIDRSRASNAPSPEAYRATRFGRWFIKRMSPGAAPIRTFAPFQPTEPASLGPEVLERFVELQNDLMNLLARADGYDLNRFRFASPVSRLVRFSIGEALTMLVVHQQRHLLQARNIAARPGFPSEQPKQESPEDRVQ